MTLAKIVVSGKVTKNPEKRFTQNNIAITSFVMDINPNDETLVRVVAIGSLADRIESEVSIGDVVLVDGRPQIETFKADSGKEKRYIEINASTIEKMNGGAVSAPQTKNEQIVKFSTQEAQEELIDEEEIPF